MDLVPLVKRAWSWSEIPTDERTMDDYQQFFELLADDVELQITCPKDTPLIGDGFHGKEAVINYYMGLSSALSKDGRMVGSPQYLATEKQVVIIGKITYTVRMSGVVVENKPFARIIAFKNSRIAQITVIEDLSEIVYAHRAAENKTVSDM